MRDGGADSLPQGLLRPQPPCNVRKYRAWDRSLAVRWEAPQWPTSLRSAGDEPTATYEMQFKEQGADAWLNTASVLRSTNCKKNNLRPSTAYLFRVRLRLPGSEWSEWSAPSDAISTLDASPQRPFQ